MSPSRHQHTLVIPPDAWDQVVERTSPGRGGTSNAMATTQIIRRYAAILDILVSAITDVTEEELDKAAWVIRRGMPPGDDLHGAIWTWAKRRPDDPVLTSLAQKSDNLSSLQQIALLDLVERRIARQAVAA